MLIVSLFWLNVGDHMSMKPHLMKLFKAFADADCAAVKPGKNKELLDQTEKTLQSRFNNVQRNLRNMIDRKFNLNALNNGNRILTYASTITVDDKKTTSETRSEKIRNNEITPTAINFLIRNDSYRKRGAEQREERTIL